ncbi:MAG: hypothetical protein K8Q99_00895 [Acholeplasmataceae bacterium]|nr:hypothetical protein [Acholeplasmataceae bacterium]
MPELKYILLVVAVIMIFSVFVFINMKQRQKIKSMTIETLKQYGKVVFKDKHILFETKQDVYEILFYKIALNHELTINSKFIWEIHTNTRSQLINQSNFLSSSYKKIVIIYPIATKIKRFINENEMVFIDFRDTFYDMRLVKINELKLALSEGDL